MGFHSITWAMPQWWDLGYRGGVGGQNKRSNIIKAQSQSQFQIFLKPNFVCLLTKERYKAYQTGFSFDRLGHAPGVGLGGTGGGGSNFSPKFNQI